MTNAEKYLKDGIKNYEFAMAFNMWCVNNKYVGSSQADKMEAFLKAKSKNILSEDEKVILRNVDNKYATIGRDEDGLFIAYYFDEYENDCNYLCFNNLFKFIKLGEEYEIAKLLGGEN